MDDFKVNFPSQAQLESVRNCFQKLMLLNLLYGFCGNLVFANIAQKFCGNHVNK